MSTQRDVDQATAERLLAGDGAGSGHDRLANLLAAAGAPARAGELNREPAALVAFRAAHPTALPVPPTPRRRAMLKLAFAKLFTAKVAAVAAAVTVAGGVAMAATGTIPNPVNGLGAVDAPADRGTPDGDAEPASHASPSPSPSLEGLCEAYLASPVVERGRTLRNPAFQVLIRVAGDQDAVDGYCADLLPGAPAEHGDASRSAPTERPVPTEQPTPEDLPDAVPTARPGHPGEGGPPVVRPGPPGQD